jgi:hypothetical protein
MSVIGLSCHSVHRRFRRTRRYVLIPPSKLIAIEASDETAAV